jgi:lysozyme
MDDIYRAQEIIKGWTKKEEGGFHASPYTDTEGNRTIGFGHNLTASGRPEQIIELEIAIRWFNEDWASASRIAEQVPGYLVMTQIRRGCLIAMAFQMGNRIHTFKKTAEYILNREYQLAATEMLRSKWAYEQSPARAWRTAMIFSFGTISMAEKVLYMRF